MALRQLQMGGGEPENEVDLPSSLAGVKLVEAPILFFVISHKAITLELADIHRVAVDALDTASQGVELVDDLSRRLDFLKIVYKYHCAAEDEVKWLFHKCINTWTRLYICYKKSVKYL